MHPDNASQHDKTSGIFPDHAVPETAGLAQTTLEGLRPTTAVLSILYLFFALAHTQLPRPLSTILVPWALCSSALLLWLRWELGRGHTIRLPIHLTSAAVAAIVLSYSLATLALTHDPSQTFNLMLLLVGGSFLFLSKELLIGVVGLDWVLSSSRGLLWRIGEMCGLRGRVWCRCVLGEQLPRVIAG